MQSTAAERFDDRDEPIPATTRSGTPCSPIRPARALRRPRCTTAAPRSLHALRVKIGDEAFFDLAKEWVGRFGGGTATTADFIALSEEISGQDLDDFFQVWAYDPPKPTSW